MSSLAIFSQELYFEESIQAIEFFSKCSETEGLQQRIADLLPQPAKSSRLRVASKIIQRFLKQDTSPSFARLIGGIKSLSARQELLYWRTARTDWIIASLARDLFYPYFVQKTIPGGYDEASFRMLNTATLFAVDEIISRDLAIAFSRDVLKFDSPRTVTLALRIMKQAEILGAILVKLNRRHVLGYFPQPRALMPEVFAYCMYEEFPKGAALDQIHNGDCVRLFFINRLQADSLLKTLEKRKLIRFENRPGGRYVSFVPVDAESLVDSLIKP